MLKVSPSVLSADFANLGREIESVNQSGSDYVHVDIMDGCFVPNISIGFPVVKAIQRTSRLPLDVHLMIDRPLRYVEQFCKAGASILTLHLEADTGENIAEALRRIRDNGVRAGLSIKPGTPASALFPYLELCDLVLVMTVEPGFGGQSFMEDMMPKLKEIRSWLDERQLSCELEVDGGINPKTASICAKNGADVFVAGSAFFAAADRGDFVAAIKEAK